MPLFTIRATFSDAGSVGQVKMVQMVKLLINEPPLVAG